MDKKILLIEDDESISFLYKRQLELAGFKTDAFFTGGEGLSALRQQQYDLLLLDIMLPDMNGLDILKQVKQNPATSALPTVLLTNLGQDSVIKEGFSLGAKGYLLKAALTPDQIVQEVKMMLTIPA